MIKFEKPQYKVTEYVESNSYGKFEIEPLERGFGTTIGNALRRVMLSSLPGSAITSVKIEGVMHEFQTIDGIMEDVTSIVLNLKNVVVKNHTEEDAVIRLITDKEGVVTAGDIECPSDVEIINKDQEIATIVKGGSLNMEMTVSNGRGFVRAEANKKLMGDTKVGVIAIDSNYSPIERVNIAVEDARVGQATNYDKLILEVWTNGAMKPEEAIALASRIIIEHFEILTELNSIADIKGLMTEQDEDPKVKALETSIDDMEFSVRAYNCLKRSGINTMQDLVNRKESDMMKIRNLGNMAYRKLGRDNKHRRAMLANLTKAVIMNESIETTETRAKEVRKFVDKMITYGKKGDLVSRRKAYAFLHNDKACVEKVFNDLAKRYEGRNGGYTRIIKFQERKLKRVYG